METLKNQERAPPLVLPLLVFLGSHQLRYDPGRSADIKRGYILYKPSSELKRLVINLISENKNSADGVHFLNMGHEINIWCSSVLWKSNIVKFLAFRQAGTRHCIFETGKEYNNFYPLSWFSWWTSCTLKTSGSLRRKRKKRVNNQSLRLIDVAWSSVRTETPASPLSPLRPGAPGPPCWQIEAQLARGCVFTGCNNENNVTYNST